MSYVNDCVTGAIIRQTCVYVCIGDCTRTVDPLFKLVTARLS